jgi:CBS domain containing-hemolysin-like protein
VRIDENTAQIDGLMRIDELNRELGTSLPEDDSYDTIAGFVLCQLRRIPEEGEKLSRANCELTVQEMKGPKIEKLLIKKG